MALCTHHRVAVGLHLVEFHAQKLGVQLAVVFEYAEDTYTSRDGVGVGHNVVGRAADVITARSSGSTHGNDDGFLLFQFHDLVPHLFRSIGRTASRVDAQHHSLHVLVVGQVAHVLAEVVPHNLAVALEQALRTGIVDDFAHGRVDGNLASKPIDRLFLQVIDRHLVDVVVLVQPQHLGNDAFRLVVVDETVDHAGLHQLLRIFQSDEAVGVGVERILAGLAATSVTILFHQPFRYRSVCSRLASLILSSV